MCGTPIPRSVRPPEAASRAAVPAEDATAGGVPGYLEDTYRWAYLRPASVRLLDHRWVVAAILWGQADRLLRAAAAELRPGERVLQPACVYGDFSERIARRLGPRGRLDVCDIAPIQVENCRRKLARHPNCRVRRHDAGEPLAVAYDAVLCFFLLHELPAAWKRRVTTALLEAVAPGGRAIFVDYHRPHRLHPLRWPMRAVFGWLEPYAEELWHRELWRLPEPAVACRFRWSKTTYFGRLYQKVVARRLDRAAASTAAPGALDSSGDAH